MKKLLFTLICLTGVQLAMAQVQFNPKIGASFLKLTGSTATIKNTSSTVETDFSADMGVLAGADVRIGHEFLFTPGLFFARNATITKFKGDSIYTGTELEDKLIRTSMKLRTTVGYKIINQKNLKLLVNAGPSYDFILSVDNSEDKIDFEENDFNGGSFNLDASVGVDIWFLTAELGYSYGLTQAFKDDADLQFDSKYNTLYLTLGIVFGKGVKE
ncbi:MAG: outer membrane beta-barrel protein [Bacteroidia bacterium]